MLKRLLLFCIIFLSTSFLSYSQETSPIFFHIKENGKFGLIDDQGNVVVEPNFEYIQYFSAKNVFWAKKYLGREIGDKYFLMCTDGSYASKDTFDMVRTIDFSVNEWAFRKQDKWGVINYKGEVLIPFEYEKLYIHEPGIISAKKLDQYGYFLAEQSFKFISFPKQDKYDYEYIGDGYFSYYDRKKQRYGIFNAIKKKFVLKPKYKDIDRVRYGQLLLSEHGKGIGIYDLNQRKFVVNMGVYIDIWMPSSPSTYVNKRAYLGGIDEDSLFIAKKEIEEDSMAYRIVTYLGEERKIGADEDTYMWYFAAGSCGFFGGCAFFNVPRKKPAVGCIDKNGNLIVDPSAKYNWIGRCSEGLIPIGRNGKFGFIDFSGKEIIPLKFSSVKTFIGGLSQVEQPIESDDTKIRKGYISKYGKWVWSTIKNKD